MIMRIAYSFTWGGRTFECAGCPIGDSANPNWFADDGENNIKWSAIYHALPEIYASIEDAFPAFHETPPEMFGFNFAELSEAI